MNNHVLNNNQQGELIPFIQNSEYFFKKSLQAYRRRDLYKAKKLLNRALHFDPEQSVYMCQLAIILSELGDYKESNDLLLAVVANIEPELLDCYYLIANNYAHLGLFQESKKYAYKYLEKDPEGEYMEDTQDLLDLLNIELEEIEIEDFMDEDNLILKQEEACLLLERGELKEAIVLLEQLIKDHPDFWSAHNNLALSFFYLGDSDKALSITHDVLEKCKGNLHALCNLTIFYHYMNKFDEVNEMVTELQKVYPMDFDHRYKLGTTFALVGRYKKAYDWLRYLHKYKYNGDSTFYYWLSVSAYHIGYTAFAKDIWETVIKLDDSKKGKEPWNKLDSLHPSH